MDKSWIDWDKDSPEYQDKVKEFIMNSKRYARNPDMIRCPCVICGNCSPQCDDILLLHLTKYGFDPMYNVWVAHGEHSTVERSARIDDCPMSPHIDEDDDGDGDSEMLEVLQMYEDACFRSRSEGQIPSLTSLDDKYQKKIEEAEVPLYPGCTKYTKLSATLNLYKLKASYGLSNSGFDSILKEFKNMLPDGNSFPESLHAVKKTLKEFDLGYEKIDACINDCILFRGDDYKDLDECPECHSSRWKVNPRTKNIKVGVSAKILRYFPILPRLQRMFLRADVSEQLTWHSTHHSQDDKMRHPVDSTAWSTVDKKWPSFAADPKNLRFGLATDGFNPFSNRSSTHSTWPVILVIYNLPPSVCMSSENLLLSLLIPGPYQPGNDIDVYLQPLIVDLKKLWDGVSMYDAYTKAWFILRAILLWTINDFPAYGNLAGLTTKGEFACPICGPETCSQWLPLAKKTVYMDHRRFLSSNHVFRSKHKWFNGRKEKRMRPKIFTGRLIVLALAGFTNKWGKKRGKTKTLKKGDPAKLLKKKSLLYELPYWEELVLRENLDVMHIEKNVSEKLLYAILDVDGRSEIGGESHRDLELQILLLEVPVAQRKDKLDSSEPYTLTKDEKLKFLWRLFMQSFPDGYCSNIGNCIKMKKQKIMGLKSHDHHVLMQQLLSVAVKGLLPGGLRTAIFRLSSFFHELCQRVLDKRRLEELEDEIIESVCLLERYFPPSFFDIMIHLTIHIAREAKLCGPVHFRWMYPFERYMKVLKDYVKNRANLEGSIAENYLADECVRFCGRYMKDSPVFSNKRKRNDVIFNDTMIEGSTLQKGCSVQLTDEMHKAVHLCVLLNSQEVVPYIQVHKDELKCSDERLMNDSKMLEKKHLETFVEWIQKKIKLEAGNEHIEHDETLIYLVKGPRRYAMSHFGFVINGKRFHTKKATVSTQDYGVHIEADSLNYYGIVQDILVLDFYTFRLTVFLCDWVNMTSGVKKVDGFTLVNLHEGLTKKDPFILASHAEQVFYSRDNEKSSWYVVLKAPPRGFYDLELFDESVFTTFVAQESSALDIDYEDM